jgi:hypothetical protein
MNNDNSGAIVFLLAAILCVLLFGSGAVLSGVGTVMTIGAVLTVGGLVVVGIARLFKSMRKEISTAQAEDKPWLYLFLLWAGGISNVVVFGLATLTWMDGNIRFGEALETIPYWWVPVGMLLVSLVVWLLECAHEWLPKLPGALAKMLKGWLWLAVAPIASPVGRWREIREDQARGDQISIVSAGFSLLGAVAAGLVLWPLTLLPVAIVMAIIEETTR